MLTQLTQQVADLVQQQQHTQDVLTSAGIIQNRHYSRKPATNRKSAHVQFTPTEPPPKRTDLKTTPQKQPPLAHLEDLEDQTEEMNAEILDNDNSFELYRGSHEMGASFDEEQPVTSPAATEGLDSLDMPTDSNHSILMDALPTTTTTDELIIPTLPPDPSRSKAVGEDSNDE